MRRPGSLLVFVGLVAFGARLEAARKAIPLGMTMGVSRTLEFPEGIGTLQIDDESVFGYRRVLRGSGAMALLLLPARPGSAHLAINDPAGHALRHYRVSVAAAGNDRALASQKEEEIASGLKVKDLNLDMGLPFTISYGVPTGPVYLTDPKILEFRRISRGRGRTDFLLVPKHPGMTDLTIHDAFGVPLAKYYVRVSP